MKSKVLKVGVVSAASPIPMFLATILWSWFIFFGVGMGLLGYDTVPGWILAIMLLPLLISPGMGIFGIIYGVRHRKERFAWLGIVLSVLSLVENGLLLFGVGYIGSRY